MDLTFQSIELRNFLSFGNLLTKVDLATAGTTLIMGENLDVGGSSGAGKTTLISAISYCLYDKIPSNVSKDRLINSTNEKKNTTMEVKLTFTKGADTYEVNRWRGASTGVQMFQNGTDITPASVNRGEDSFNAKLEEVLGFSYRLFERIILFSGNDKPFLASSVGDQRATIEELFKITTLSKKARVLKDQINSTDKSISMQKVLIKQQELQNENHRKHVKEAEARILKWSESHQLEVDKSNTLLVALAAVDFETEETVHQQINEIEASVFELDAAIKVLTAEKSAKERERSTQATDLALNNAKLRKDVERKEKLKSEHEHLTDAKCPYCMQDFAEAKEKAVGVWSNYTEVSAEINAAGAANDLLAEEIQAFDAARVAKVAELSEQIINRTARRDAIKSEVAALRSSLSYPNFKDHVNAAKEIHTLADRIEKLSVVANPHIDAHAALLAEGEISIDIDGLDTLIKFQEHQQFLLKLLTDKNSFIRKNIISKTIPFLNKRIGYYTEKLNLPHMILFQPDMSCEISQMGRTLDHGNLSNGEKKKLNISLCLAFRDVLTYLHSKVNVLFTDEIDGGSISGPDVDSLISMLKHKAWDDNIAIFIISHRPEFEGRCDRNLIVRKEGGFSVLLTQPED